MQFTIYRVCGGATEQRGQLGFDRVVRQRRQPHDGVRGPAEVQRGRVEWRPAAQHHQQGTIAQPVRQCVHALDRRGVRPLQVLDHQHQRPLGEAALEHRAQRHEDLALEPLGFDLARVCNRLQAQDVADDRDDQSHLHVLGAQAAQAMLDLAARFVQRVR